MSTPAIPVENTVLFNELLDPEDGAISTGSTKGDVHINEEYYSLLHDDDVFPMERPFETDDSDNDVMYLADNYRVTLDRLRKAVLLGLQSIRPWQPRTEYKATLTDPLDKPIKAPDVFTNAGSMYLTTIDHRSRSEVFSQKGTNYIASSNRFTMDNDIERVEITANIRAPIVTGDEIGAYVTQRVMSIEKEYTFPNEDLAATSPNALHHAFCNPQITAPCTVIIKRLEESALVTIGTITFTPNGDATHRIEGEFTFNDPAMGADGSHTLYLGRGDMIIFEAGTVTPELEWVRLGMIAEAISFTDAGFDAPA